MTCCLHHLLRSAAALSAVSLLLAAGKCPADETKAGRATGPNILLIVSEDHGMQLSCYGDKCVSTPRIDELAEDGVLFEQAYVTQAGCSPSRASILTGLYPHQNGQIGLATHNFRMFHNETPNLVGCLKQAGYRTGVIGKIHVNPESAFPYDLRATGATGFHNRDYAKVASTAGKFMGGEDRPFFLWISLPDAHRPWLDQHSGSPQVPLTSDQVEPLNFVGVRAGQTMKMTASYYNCMLRLDEGVGRILDALEQTGKADNTLVVFLGDHGPSFPRGKMTAYEGGVRVPLLMRWPGHMDKGRRVGELVSAVDLMPTLLAAAGVETPADLPGRSLLPLARGEKCDWREHLFTEFTLHWPETYFPQRTVRDRRYKLIHNLLPGRENPVFGWCHVWELKIFGPEAVDGLPAPWDEVYRRFRRPPEFELYDLQNDPWETRNLAGDKAHADTLERLKEVLAAWQERTGDALRKPELLERFSGESDATLTGAEGINRGKYRRKRDWQYVEYLYER